MKGGVGGGGVEKPLLGVWGRSPRRGFGGSAPDRRRHRQSPSVARAAKRQRADRIITFKCMAALGRAIGREPPKGVRACPKASARMTKRAPTDARARPRDEAKARGPKRREDDKNGAKRLPLCRRERSDRSPEGRRARQTEADHAGGVGCRSVGESARRGRTTDGRPQGREGRTEGA